MENEIMLNILGRVYFHQDFDADGNSPTDIVRIFANEGGIQIVQLFYVQLAEILVSGISEGEARQLWLGDAHSMYEPSKDAKSNLDWLKEVLMIVGEVLRQRWLTPRDSIDR